MMHLLTATLAGKVRVRGPRGNAGDVRIHTRSGRYPMNPLLSIRRAVVSTAVSLSLAAGLVAGLLVGGSAASATTYPTQSHMNTVAAQVLNLLNTERKSKGLPALTRNQCLWNTARAHNKKMLAYNTMSHQLPGELSLGSRITRAGYHWTYVGENVAFNTDWSLAGAYALETMMFNEVAPNNGHRLNILSTHYTNIGLDILVDTKHHKIWLTEDFGRGSGSCAVVG